MLSNQHRRNRYINRSTKNQNEWKAKNILWEEEEKEEDDTQRKAVGVDAWVDSNQYVESLSITLVVPTWYHVIMFSKWNKCSDSKTNEHIVDV